MAKVDILAPFILSFEGGYVNHPNDKGGATNKGVTLETWRVNGRDINGDGKIDEKDLKLITEEEAISIMKKNYWDKMKADEIKSQSIANLIVDWGWGSGPGTAAKKLQRILGTDVDGIIGPKTIAAINAQDPATLFNKIHNERKLHFESIVQRDPTQQVFLKGWLRRLDSIQFESLKCNGGKMITFEDLMTPPATHETTETQNTTTSNKKEDNSGCLSSVVLFAGLVLVLILAFA
ncbi:MAG: peptidoglycan domain protein [Bacteroidales bacterium]|nr:peptidoglycan domain protein [Bacteroidales bacterium]